MLVARVNFGPLELGLSLAILGSILALVGGRGEVLRFETTANPQQVINSAITIVGTHRRWATLSQTDSAVTFGYHRPPSKLLACFLLLLFVVPGIVYLVLAGRRESLSVSAATRDKPTAVQSISNGWRGRAAGRELRKQLVAETHPLPAPQAEAPPGLADARL